MKTVTCNFMTLLLLLCCAATGCKKHHDYPRSSRPQWTVDTTGKYPVTMTAVVELPLPMQYYVQSTDEIGAFIGNECRGVGTFVRSDTSKVFFIMIHGTASEQAKISFKYYSTWTSYLYNTDAFLNFTMDGNFGTVDAPAILNLRHAN